MNPLSFIATSWQRLVSEKAEVLQADDGQSVLSKSDTLFDASDSKDAQSPPAGQKTRVNLGASSASFAKAAKQEGWGSPTATRPSLGGI